jgi:hypothetical protein
MSRQPLLEIVMKKLLAVLAVLLVSSSAYAKGAKKNLHRPRRPVTSIDAGGRAEPESPWPEIAKKGPL